MLPVLATGMLCSTDFYSYSRMLSLSIVVFFFINRSSSQCKKSVEGFDFFTTILISGEVESKRLLRYLAALQRGKKLPHHHILTALLGFFVTQVAIPPDISLWGAEKKEK